MANKQVTDTNNTWNAFMALLRAALHDSNPVPLTDIDWRELFFLANRHHVLPLVVDTACQTEEIPPALQAEMLGRTVRIYAQQTIRTIVFLRLYQQLIERRLHPVVLKGLICRSLYPDPDQRPSNDEDLLIAPEEFPATHEALLSFGLKCDLVNPDPSLHEITYTGQDLRIELHLSFFPADSEAYGDCNRLFIGASERTEDVTIEGVSIRTLAPTDHLLYLICHAYKHFLHSGVGVRQVCDIGMFSKKYAGQIDWPHIRRSCDSIRMSGFAASVFRIGANYLGFEMPVVFSDIDVDEKDMLRDMLSGGIYGAIEQNRQHSATITLDAVASQKQGRTSSGLLASVFLPLKSMEEKYPYLKKHPWLLPAAWVQRIGHYVLGSNSDADPAESIKIGNQRVALLREYGIID